MAGFNLPPGVTVNDIPGNEPDTSDIPEVGEEWFKRAKLVMPDGPAPGPHTYRGVHFRIQVEATYYDRKRGAAWMMPGDLPGEVRGHGYYKWVDKTTDAASVDKELILLAWNHARTTIDRMLDGHLQETS